MNFLRFHPQKRGINYNEDFVQLISANKITRNLAKKGYPELKI